MIIAVVVVVPVAEAAVPLIVAIVKRTRDGEKWKNGKKKIIFSKNRLRGVSGNSPDVSTNAVDPSHRNGVGCTRNEGGR
jgi:hypothetical protein